MTNKEITNAYYGADQVEKIYLGSDVIWPAQEPGPGPGPGPEPAHDYSKDYLTIETGTGTLYWRKPVEYSKNGAAWTSASTSSMEVSSGDKIRFRITSTSGTRTNGLFSGNTVSMLVYGNIESLEYGDNFTGKTTVKYSNAFQSLFQDCTNLDINVDGYKLILPATTLKASCYLKMFRGCTRIQVAPDLPAPTLLNNSYREMFYNCNNLNYIKCLATSKATDSTTDWVYGVQTTSGTFVKDPSVDAGYGHFWTLGIGGIPQNWTIVDAT